MTLISVYLFWYMVVALAVDGSLEGKEGKYTSIFRVALYSSTTAALIMLAICCFFGNGWNTSETLDVSKVANPRNTIIGVVVNFFIIVGPYGCGIVCLVIAFGQFHAFKEEREKIAKFKTESQSKKSA